MTRQLVVRLLSVQGMVVLSGYENPTYAPLEAAGWVRKSHSVPAYSSDRRSRRVECLWLSPNLVKGPEEPAGTPTDRMREGAHATHRARASQTEAKLRAV